MNKHIQDEEKAPLFGRWTAWYVLVVVVLLLLIACFYQITKTYS
ncbi:hypothetical protein [Niabella drilacis]|uniref:Uncharacterized protein n=1 Tax=Niabella drilacis (strain DSM 25811 / CCM 8410 / CCUG 62505 / LMG 26954 / E90) TaxID=1285928 RepID=A0A1G6TVZ2_NIADE|nr:hypothetical protein [Niabella drilacis]SDD33211.1 hypothetical protein SAMN04487894_10855 [Niabella drilacis]